MDVGRIFFHPASAPTRATVIALESHVGNVVELINYWCHAKAYCSDCDVSLTRERLLEAARRHDEAKRETFRVTYEDKRWGYSFSGHRFRVPCDDLYVDALIKMHHEFSVEGVAEWQARLRREGGKEWGEIYFRNFPFDLYTLEMCDQVAAEVESYTFQGHADERAFMELHSRKRADGSVEIEPFPFEPSPLTLTVCYAEFPISNDLRDAGKLTDKLREWQPPPKLQERKVTLCSST